MSVKLSTGLSVEAGGRTGSAYAAGRLASQWVQRARHLAGKARGAGWALGDQCVVSAGNFLTIFLFARFLETTVFGAFMLAYTGLLLLTNMQNALVLQPHNVLGAGMPQAEYRRFTGALLALQLLYAAGVCTALCLVAAAFALAGAGTTATVVLALALTAVPWMGQDFVRRVLYTRGDSRAAALNGLIVNSLQLFGAAVLVYAAAAWATPASALWVLGVAAVVGVAFGAWQLRDHVTFDRPGSGTYRKTWAEAWHFGKWLTAQNGVAWFGAQGHSWVVGILLGVEQVGIYRAATHLVNVMNPLFQACFSYLPSRGSLAYLSGGAAGLARWIRQARYLLLLAVLPFCVVLVGFPGAVLHLAYGGRFDDSDLALILALATIGQCIGFSKYPFDIGLLALRATKSIFYVYLIPIALLLIVGTSLIAWLGILGVPISGLLINTTLFAATWRAYRLRMREERGAPRPGGEA